VKTETKIVLGFIVLLVCCTGLILTSATRQPSAEINFSEARISAGGNLIIEYSSKASSKTLLREMDFIDGTKVSEGYQSGSGGPLFGLGGWGKSRSESSVSDLPPSPPSMLVITGKIYRLKLNDSLMIYDFTNNSGKAYCAKLSLERQ
jgi:hypothetical protein